MTTKDKLLLIVDKLLVKTQDNLCEWKKQSGSKYVLRMPVFADIVIYLDIPINGSYHICLDVVRNDMVLASVHESEKETQSTLVRLFGYVQLYHENYLHKQLTELMGELNKLGGDKPI